MKKAQHWLASRSGLLTLLTLAVLLGMLGIAWRLYTPPPPPPPLLIAYHLIFLVLVVLNLVAGFQALGTLMAVGLMMLPAITARLWAQSVGGMLLTAITLALGSGLGGLLCSYHFDLPSGPAIILFAGSLYLLSLLFAPAGGVLPRLIRQRHLAH